MSDEKVSVDISYYRDANGDLCERRRIEGKVVYDQKVLYWHGLPPTVMFRAEPWPWGELSLVKEGPKAMVIYGMAKN